MVQAPPLPSPLAPFLSHAAGEALTFPPSPLPLPRCGRGRGRDERSRGDPAAGNDTAFTTQITPLPQGGRGAGGEGGPHLPPSPLPLSPSGSGRGGRSGAGAILRLATIPRLRPRSPLSRRAGKGLGVRAALTFSPGHLPLPRCGSGGGMMGF